MQSSSDGGHGNSSKLGWFLCWAVVFADIGTSLYYVPGILFGEVNNLAGLFVLMSSIVFVLLVLKYIEITERYPEGGGVVTVATHAFGPWFGALGGMFITVDYFLTAAISSVSGFAYLNSIVGIGSLIVPFSILSIGVLGVLNVIGIKESAKVTAVVAVAAFVIDIILVTLVATQVGPEGWGIVFGSLSQISRLAPWPLLTGFAGSFLAFSGLESISQLSPAMQTPRKKVATIAMGLVVAAILLTSPLLTLFSTNLLTTRIPGQTEPILETVAKVKEREKELAHVQDPKQREELETQITQGESYSERFISEVGAQYGGPLMKIAVVATASVLLLFAANTAIIGAYHVFIALSRQHFLPQVLQTHNQKFGTPHWSVLLAVAPPIMIVLATQGNVALLGQLYAFGLLGAFGLSSLGLDIVRWKEGQRMNLSFVLGVITTILVCIAWGTNLYNKQLATVFGGTITAVGMIIAYLVHRSAQKEEHVSESEFAVVKPAEAPQRQIFVPVFGEFDSSLFDYAARYAKHEEKSINLLYIREFTDVLSSIKEDIDKDEEAAEFLRKAVAIIKSHRVAVQPMYTASGDTAKTINKYRRKMEPFLTILSPHRQSVMLDFLRGNVIKDVIGKPDGNVLIYTGSEETNAAHETAKEPAFA